MKSRSEMTLSLDTDFNTENATEFRLYRDLGKRVFDILICLIVLPLAAPIILVAWFCVRLDGGPGYYSQPRVGHDGRIFQFWKLRSMVVNADSVLADYLAENPVKAKEWSENQKLRDDPRVTYVGKFIRRTSLDELPQLWNILRGQMSFVGPRPFMISQKQAYDLAGGHSYYRLRPGLTGLWQIQARGKSNFTARIGYDEEYERTLSFSQDLLILIKTIGVFLQGTGQ